MAIALTILTGCGVATPVISVTPVDSHQRYLQHFTQAFTMRDSDGDYQVVLTHDPLDDVPPADANKPLVSTAVPPIRQVLEIRLLWRPMAGATANSPAATNAALHWYVLGRPTVEGTSMIHYSGTAFVSITPGGAGASVILDNGLLKLAESRGELVDRLGMFKIKGRFDAVESAAQVRQILDDVKAAVADARASSNPPATLPAIPQTDSAP